MKVKKLFERLTVFLSVLSIVVCSFGFSGVFAEKIENNYMSMLNVSNAKLKILTSNGVSEGNRVFDDDYVTTTSLKNYDGVKIFDKNGNSGSDYMAVIEIAIK